MLTELVLDAFVPPLEPGTLRAEEAVRAIEKSWPVHLICEVDNDGKRIRHDHDRPSYLTSDPRGLAFIASAPDEPQATLTGLLEGEFLAPCGVDELHVLGHLPSLDAHRAAHGLMEVADALHAKWAMLTPGPAHALIVEQVIAADSENQPPESLPRLDPAEYLAEDVPRRLGWISYWSDRVAARLGFAGETEPFASVRRVKTGWIVQLTDEPLDLDRSDHRGALRAGYDRYPAIGRAKRT